MTETPESFAELLLKFRIASNLTQNELAEKTGLSARGISDLERAKRTQPRPDTIRRLANALKLPPDQRGAFIAAARAAGQAARDQRHSSTVASPEYLPSTSRGEDYDPSLLTATQHARQRRQHNLPIAPTPLVDRATEVAQLTAWLRREDVRLVNLTGAGGVGKTRLALQAAAQLVDHYRDGVWLVRLERLSDSALVLPTIAETLGLRESGDQAVERVLREYLRERRMLLVLDNFEHLLPAAPAVAELLAGSPGLKVLVTSRTRLHLRGEQEVRVPPLALADSQHQPSLEEYTQYPALNLFIQRAQDVKSDFQLTTANASLVAEICAQLYGLPLAIELAAAWVRILPSEALHARLTNHLALLVGGAIDAEPRQRTMRATIAWSEDLLTRAEQRLFWRIAVFVGGSTLEAVESVCRTPPGIEPLGGEVLTALGALVDANLVQQREVAGEVRFSLLQVIREYALERLEASGEAEGLRRAHATYFLTRVDAEVYAQVPGPQLTQRLTEVEGDYDNLRAALTWACAREKVDLGLRLGAALGSYWLLRGHLREGRRWLETLVVLAVGSKLGEARVHGVEAVEAVQRRAGPTAARKWVNALGFAYVLAANQNDEVQALAGAEETVVAARKLGYTAAVADSLNHLGVNAVAVGDTARGLALLDESLELARQLPDNSGLLMGSLKEYATTLLLVPGGENRAVTLVQESLELAQRAGSPIHQIGPRQVLAVIARRRGDLVWAGTLMDEALRLAWDRGLTVCLPDLLNEVAMIADGQGHDKQAARLLGAAARTFEIAECQPDPRLSVDVEAMMVREQAALGEEAWAEAFAAGQKLTLEDAIAVALVQVKVEVANRQALADESCGSA